ncbi:nicotinamide N-methyltransferase-like [Pseudophryne corroboree]|uniref:nicotinamide N-methyltransferase-like n=1 Tax=Pseudophryne corroboree TaxID=495146 RepID=UPI0030818E6D
MASTACKVYHKDGFDSRTFLETYFSSKPDMVYADDTLKYPMKKLREIFSAGHIKGNVLIDISLGPFIHHLLTASTIFKDIYLLRFREECIMELSRWLNTRTGAFEWNHAKSYLDELDGGSDQCEDKETKMKSAINHIVKWDIDTDTVPVVLPAADCVITAWLLDTISTDQDDYITNLKKITKFVGPGCHLILIGALNASYFTVVNEKFHIFNYDEAFVRKALTGEGFVIDHCDIFTRESVSDLSDHGAIIFITAHIEK